MRISVVYSAQLGKAAGIDRELLDIDGPQTLQDFTTLLAERRGGSFMVGDHAVRQFAAAFDHCLCQRRDGRAG